MHRVILSVALLALAGCGGPQYQPATSAEAAAFARCSAQGLQAGAPVRNMIESAVTEVQVRNLCMQAWHLDQNAEAQRRADDARQADQRAAQASAQAIAAQQAENDARARAGRDCRGARNHEACVQGIVASVRASVPAITIQPTSAAAPARCGSDRPCYDW
jgi:hypothetical protein